MIGRGRALAMAAALGLAAGASAAPPTDQGDALTTARQRLVVAKQQSAAAQARSRAFEEQAAEERDAATKARQEESATAARIQQAQADLAAAQARIAIIQAQQDDERATLAGHQGPIVRLLAALESLASRPAVVGIVQPGSVDDMVHVRAVLGTVTPVVRARTADIRAEIADTRALRAKAALAMQSLTDSRRALDTQQLALARLQAAHQARSQTLDRKALAASDEALAEGERARDLVDLMGTLGDAADTRAALADLPDPAPRPADLGEAVAGVGLVPWPQGGAPYELPAQGRLVTGLGEISDAGVRSRGLTLATAPDAAVIAPAGGRVAYARPFRRFGTIVIIDHGDGWTTLITGLGGASVTRGDAVSQGEAIGRAGDGDAPRITVELRRQGRPVDIVPLLG